MTSYVSSTKTDIPELTVEMQVEYFIVLGMIVIRV